MSPSPRRKLGDIGEGVACKYLVKQGYTIIDRNYWRPWGEIDIVVKKGDRVDFIEVKSISCENRKPLRVRPEENMHPAKLRKLQRAVQTYLLDHKVPEETEWQISLACVFLNFDTKVARVEMLENIV